MVELLLFKTISLTFAISAVATGSQAIANLMGWFLEKLWVCFKFNSHGICGSSQFNNVVHIAHGGPTTRDRNHPPGLRVSK